MVNGYDLKEEWRRLIDVFEKQLAYLDDGLLLHSAGRDSNEFTEEWKRKLRADIAWYTVHLDAVQDARET